MEVCYRYDGTFAGFLTCVFESFAHHEPPLAFRLTGEDFTLYEEREIVTDEAKARRVYAGLKQKVSPYFRELISRGFLTCLPNREMVLWALIDRGFREGDVVSHDLSDPVRASLTLALRKLWTEEDHLKGFVRFVDVGGLLAGEIEPKNRVLPLLGPHFANRFPNERIVLYDRTHHEVLLCESFRWAVTPAEDFSLPSADHTGPDYQRLWKQYFQTIAIEGRTNPKCQSTHLPKRYRHLMTEFREEPYIDRPALP